MSKDRPNSWSSTADISYAKGKVYKVTKTSLFVLSIDILIYLGHSNHHMTIAIARVMPQTL